MSEIDAEEVLRALLENLVSLTESKEELIKLWFYIGTLMGIKNIFPEMQIVAAEDDEGKVQPCVLIGTTHQLIIDYLSDPKVMTEDVARLALREIKKLDEDQETSH